MRVSVKKIGWLGLTALIGLIGLVAVAAQNPRQTVCGPQPNGDYILCAEIPGLEGEGRRITGLADLVKKFFKGAVGLGGAVAFVVIAWNGVVYMLEGGNIFRQGEAISGIWNALLGLLLLLGATLVLFNINPALVKIEEIEIPKASLSPRTLVGIGDQLATDPAAIREQIQEVEAAMARQEKIVTEKQQEEAAARESYQEALKRGASREELNRLFQEEHQRKRAREEEQYKLWEQSATKLRLNNQLKALEPPPAEKTKGRTRLRTRINEQGEVEVIEEKIENQ